HGNRTASPPRCWRKPCAAIWRCAGLSDWPIQEKSGRGRGASAKRMCRASYKRSGKKRKCAGDSAARNRRCQHPCTGFVYRRGKPFQLLRKALEGEINLTVSQAIIDETVEVLSRKFGATAEDLAEAKAIIGEV